MTIPDYQSLMLPLLRALGDGEDHELDDLRDQMAAELKLSAEDRAEMLPSGRQAVFDNRVGWAKTYMDKAGLLASVRRGVYRITDAGRKVLAKKPGRIDNEFLSQFDSFRAFKERTGEDAAGGGETVKPIGPQGATPEEALERAYGEIRRKVEADLLDAVGKASPKFFEKLVVDLLVKMDYGGGREDAGQAIGRSHDGGVDGVIKEDHLGLDAIYVQAKRQQGNIGRQLVQAFAGSLEGVKARKGVFMTTASFSTEARDYVKNIDKKIVLIDGRQLATLMVDFGIGVNTVNTYEIARVDGDYFTED
jgi:restriction system protein